MGQHGVLLGFLTVFAHTFTFPVDFSVDRLCNTATITRGRKVIQKNCSALHFGASGEVFLYGFAGFSCGSFDMLELCGKGAGVFVK